MELNRRRLLQVAGTTGALGALTDCVSVSPSTAAGPSLEELDEAASTPVLVTEGLTSPVVLESARLLQKGDEYFVHVRSTDGAEGVSVPNSRADVLYPIFHELITPYLIGKDMRDLENHLWELYRYGSNYKMQGLAFWCPHAWMEFAILDMLGRVANRSVGELLGGVIHREIPYYVASGRRDTTAEEEVEYLQQLIEESGAKAVKYRLGGRMSRNVDALPGRSEALIPLSRKVLGDDIDIHADSNSSYDPAHAIAIGRMLEDIDAVYFEEPCPFDHLEETKAVTDALDIPVAGGEQEFSHYRFRWMIHNRGVDIVQPDLHYYGGMIRSIRVARMADLAGMPTTLHTSGGFGTIQMLHFASVVKDIGAYQEYKLNIERYSDWFDPPLVGHDGSFPVPEGPGFGIKSISDVLDGAEEVA